MQLSGGEPGAVRSVHFHDPAAPRAAAVVPSVFVAVRDAAGRLLLVRRCDDGTWELPGGQVEVGENAIATAVRETAEETGVDVRVTGLVGLYTDPGHVVRSVRGAVRQQFVVVLRADVVSGEPRPDREETTATGWFTPEEALRLPLRDPVRRWITDALAGGPPRLE
ncbi:NUDIX domain-containing protein [Pseudonocardia zijingensis]|uniref:NUDIX domain-containing protein n=1 Tax=Pseudonocardia zijingensis TaxID=153376 RepID=A0ABN1PWP2_9PSEU